MGQPGYGPGQGAGGVPPQGWAPPAGAGGGVPGAGWSGPSGTGPVGWSGPPVPAGGPPPQVPSSPRRRGGRWWLLVALVVVVAVVVVLGYLAFRRPTPKPAASPSVCAGGEVVTRSLYYSVTIPAGWCSETVKGTYGVAISRGLLVITETDAVGVGSPDMDGKDYCDGLAQRGGNPRRLPSVSWGGKSAYAYELTQNTDSSVGLEWCLTNGADVYTMGGDTTAALLGADYTLADVEAGMKALAAGWVWQW